MEQDRTKQDRAQGLSEQEESGAELPQLGSFSERARRALQIARSLAVSGGLDEVHVEHLVMGVFVAAEQGGADGQRLADAGVEERELREVLNESSERKLPETFEEVELDGLPALSEHATQAVRNAERIRAGEQQDELRTQHLLAGALQVDSEPIRGVRDRWPELVSAVSEAPVDATRAAWPDRHLATASIRGSAEAELAIPDDDPAGVTSVIPITNTGWVVAIRVTVAIRHTWRGDLRVILIDPSGREVILRDRTGGSANDVRERYDSSEHAALGVLVGSSVAGDWTLRVADFANMDIGVLERWELEIEVTQEQPAELPGRERGPERGPGGRPRKGQPVEVPIHSDDPAEVDELMRAPFADVIAASIQQVWDRKQAESATRQDSSDAFIVHIHGPWGSGKTSVLNFLRERLRSGRAGGSQTSEKKDGFIVVDFNAWQHERTRPPWWPLIRAVYRQGIEQLSADAPLRAWRLRLRELGLQLRTGVAPYVLAGIVLFWLVAIAARLFGDGSGSSAAAGAKVAVEILAVAFTAWGLLLGGFRTLLHGSSHAAKLFLEFSRDPLRPLVLRFRHLVAGMKRPVAVFIDDLDRCDSDYVIELLRGVQTLFHESNVTYVVAADREWLRACYERAYDDFMDKIGEPGRPLGYLFLDKLFQISTPMPRLTPERQRSYLGRLVGVGEAERTGQGSEQRTDRSTDRSSDRSDDRSDDQRTDRSDVDPSQAERAAVAEAERELADTFEHEQVLEKIHAVKDDPRKQRAYRAVAARRTVSAEAKRRTEHALQDYAHLVEVNPRAMKRLVNAFAIHNAVNILSERDVPLDPLVRWTIVTMRWPILALHLERTPELVAEIGAAAPSEHADAAVRGLLTSRPVVDVVRGRREVGATPLDEATLRRLIGDPTGPHAAAAPHGAKR